MFEGKKKSIFGREKSNEKIWITNQSELAPIMQEIFIGRFHERYSKCNSKSIFQSDTLIPVRGPSKVQSVSSVAQSCSTLCDPMDCSKPGFPVHHQLLELAQTHVHRVGDASQPSHPLLSPSSLAFSPSQHQKLFQ